MFRYYPVPQPLGRISIWIPVIIIGIAAAAHQSWSANIFTTVSDMFPKHALPPSPVSAYGRWTGFLPSIKFGHPVRPHGQGANVVHGFQGIEAGYFIIFCICARHLIGWSIMKTLVPKYSLSPTCSTSIYVVQTVRQIQGV